MNKLEEVLIKLEEMENQCKELQKIIKEEMLSSKSSKRALEEKENNVQIKNNLDLTIDEVLDYEFIFKNYSYQSLITRVKNILVQNGIKCLRDIEKKSIWEIFAWRKTGVRTIAFIIVLLEKYDIFLEDNVNDYRIHEYNQKKRSMLKESLIKPMEEFKNNIIF